MNNLTNEDIWAIILSGIVTITGVSTALIILIFIILPPSKTRRISGKKIIIFVGILTSSVFMAVSTAAYIYIPQLVTFHLYIGLILVSLFGGAIISGQLYGALVLKNKIRKMTE